MTDTQSSGAERVQTLKADFEERKRGMRKEAEMRADERRSTEKTRQDDAENEAERIRRSAKREKACDFDS